MFNTAVGILLRVTKKLPPMPQSPMDIFRWYFPLPLPTDIFRRYLTGSLEIFIAHATITDG
jgi:hypothetical protein